MIQEARSVHQGIEVPELSRDCCVQTGRKRKLITYEEIVWAESSGDAVDVSYVQLNDDKDKGTLATARLRLGDEEPTSGTNWPQFLLDESYTGCRRQKSLFVLINPHSGPGNAERLYYEKAAKIFKAARCKVTVETTKQNGHAEELMQSLDVKKYDAIVCVSGDGLPHEVINGLAQRPDGAQVLASMPICQLPGGSGNALCYSLNGTADVGVACLNIVKGLPTPVDLMALTQPSQAPRYSFLSQSWGIVADCDLGTDAWRWMGAVRFQIGLLIKLFNARTYPCRLSYKLACPEDRKAVIAYFNEHRSPGFSRDAEEDSQSLELVNGTVDDPVPDDWVTEDMPNAVNIYTGKMPWMAGDAIVFPYALPQDGAMDMITWSSNVKFFDAINRFTSMTTATHVNSPALSYRKVQAYRLEPHSKEFLSIDGESYPCEPFQVEIIPRAGCLLSRGDYHPVPSGA